MKTSYTWVVSFQHGPFGKPLYAVVKPTENTKEAAIARFRVLNKTGVFVIDCCQWKDANPIIKKLFKKK